MNIRENSKLAIELWRRMKRIRMIEEEIVKQYPSQEMRCPTHLCIGQEAVSASVGLILNRNDFAVSGHRAHGHYIGKGGNLKKMIAEIYGKVTGCCKGKGGSMHLVDRDVNFMGSTAIVGGTIPVGVGLGFSINLQNTDQVSCIFFGDGAVEEGVFYESVNFAAHKKLPVLFICENNLYSVYSPLKVRQPEGRKIHEMVKAIGIESQDGNGNDALEIYLKIRDATECIRQGGGPHFFEFYTYRWREHCGPNYDNDIGYRPEEEFLKWKQKDPIATIESRLLEISEIIPEDINKLEEELQKEIDEAFSYAKTSPFPSQEEAFKDLYYEPEAGN